MTGPGAIKPRVGVVALAYPGFFLGEEMCAPKREEMLRALRGEAFDVRAYEGLVLDEKSARQAGAKLAEERVDCILAVLTTFVPDYFITELLAGCDAPIFLWAVEREVRCLSLVCGPMTTATLYNLGKHYRLAGANIPDADALAELRVFARGCSLRNALRSMRVGYVGGKCPIMFSMAIDEYALQEKFGTALVNLPIEELYDAAKVVPEKEAQDRWSGIQRQVGKVCVSEADGLLSTRYLLAAERLVEQYGLNAISINCFPHLKAKVCLAVSCLNDAGVAAACEGDLHSTLLMQLVSRLTGQPAFNGDFLRLYSSDNSILFSHCGAGAFGLAGCSKEICLNASPETQNGLAVFYATPSAGGVTLCNLIYGRGTLRLAAMRGEGIQADMEYEGTPLRVRFKEDVRTIVQRVAQRGAGHHWNGGAGDWMKELALLCELTGIQFNALTE